MGDIAELYDYVLWEEDPKPHYRRFPSCKRCGKTRLTWRYKDGRYVLANAKGNKIHRCDPTKIAAIVANEFEVIDE